MVSYKAFLLIKGTQKKQELKRCQKWCVHIYVYYFLLFIGCFFKRCQMGGVVVFNTTFNNISVILWQSVLLVE